MSMAFQAYRAVTLLVSPFLPAMLRSRVKSGKEDEARLAERFGRSSLPRPKGPLIWMHGASVGESALFRLLIAKLIETRPDLRFLITTQTATSAKLLTQNMPPCSLHQMAPLDTGQSTRRFLDHWSPDLAIFAEGDIWPNLLNGLDKRNIPRALINARMTEKSRKGWGRFPSLAKKLFAGFKIVLAANAPTAEALSQLSGTNIPDIGNLKHAAPAPAFNESAMEQEAALIGQRPVFLAASTHDGDEALILKAWAIMMPHLQTNGDGSKRPLLMLVPRHPERAAEIEALCTGYTSGCRSKQVRISNDLDIYIADTMGEMGLWLALSQIVYLGGGIHGQGIFGHNPLEPFKHGKFVISGSDVSNFGDEFETLVSGKAAAHADDAEGLSQIALPFMRREKAGLESSDPRLANVFSDKPLTETVRALEPLLPKGQS